MSKDASLERGWPSAKDDSRKGFKLWCPYDQGLVEAIKDLPRSDRQWDGECWWIAEEHEDTIGPLVVELFGALRIIGKDGQPDEITDRHGNVVRQDKLL